MADYFKVSEKALNTAIESITEAYNAGFLFTRKAKNLMIETISLRINLMEFNLSSENRRVLRKAENIKVQLFDLPYSEYNWQIHTLGKEFYTKKFGDNIMSASKIKEIFTDPAKSNFNKVFRYSDSSSRIIGYTPSFINEEIVHYAYPFYDLTTSTSNNIGMAMMLLAINWSKENGKKYIYLGSVTKKSSLYKLQFNSIEWWNYKEKTWDKDPEKLKLEVSNLDQS